MRSLPRCRHSFRLLDHAPCSQDRTRIIANGDEFRKPICPVGKILQKCDTPDWAYEFFNCPNLSAMLRLATLQQLGLTTWPAGRTTTKQ